MATRRTSRPTAQWRPRPARTRNTQSLYRRPLRFETLEDRRLLALVTVTTLADSIDSNDGLTSLREAILTTNLLTGHDTVNFDLDLTAEGPATILLARGELPIIDSLTVAGPGAELLTIDASGNDSGARIFNIDDAIANVADVSLRGLTLTGGKAAGPGGAVFSRESLSIESCTIVGNFSSVTGSLGGGGVAAILNQGASIHIADSLISNNRASGGGGGIYLDVAANGTATVSNSKLNGNQAAQSGGAILVANNLGAVVVRDSEINANAANSSGGGISSNGNLTIERSTFVENSAQSSGGGISKGGTGKLVLTDSEVLNNSAASGGGIRIAPSLSSQSMVSTITRTTIRENKADGVGANGLGGGIYAEQSLLHIFDSVIDTNTARVSGGGVHMGSGSGFPAPDALIEGSLITNNSASSGGGILLTRGGVIRQSTIAGNSAMLGGGIHASLPTTIDQSTVSENVAENTGGAVYIASGSLQTSHSILANNLSLTTGGDIARGSNATVASVYSLIGNNDGSGLAEAPIGSPDANGNLIGGATHGEIDPLLRPFADYGGPFQTYALSPDSPAVDMGDLNRQSGVNGVPLYDQRGEPFSRVVNGRIDIGAVEFQAPPPNEIIVDTLADESDGNYAPGDLSLREAFQLANLAADASAIQFASALTAQGPAVITLTRGALHSVASVSILGPGPHLLTIDASGSDITPGVGDGQGAGIFVIGDNDEELFDAQISGLALTGGDAQYGGAILATENLSLQNCTITGNYASAFGGGVALLYGHVTINNCVVTDNGADLRNSTGGGIAVSSSASLLITNSTISNNTSAVGGGIHAYDTPLSILGCTISNNGAFGTGSSGGGIFYKGDSLSLADSTVSGNTAVSGGGIYSDGIADISRVNMHGNYAYLHGGGIYAFGSLKVRNTTISSSSAGLDGAAIHAAGNVAIEGSTLAGNEAGRHGGAVWVEVVEGTLAITNSTISGNSADNEGGGVWITGVDATATIAHSTIYDNHTSHIFGFGGGVRLNSGSLQLDHTIVAQNSSHDGPDILGRVDTHITAQYSLVGSNQNSGVAEAPVGAPDANGNMIGGPEGGSIDPLLGALADNGGPTLTHALLPGSPAINAGDLNAQGGAGGVPLYDQRGEPFDRIFGGRIDIGAFEYQEPSDLNLLVDTLVDESDGNYSRSDLSLREAIELANLWPSTDTIHFDPALTAAGPAAILLTQGELKITDDVTITGPGADLLTIDASGNDPTPTVNNGDGSRIFNIDNRNASVDIGVSIAGLTLTGGDVAGIGGAIFSGERLTVHGTVIADNSARGMGSAGAIANASGVLTIASSTITGNSAARPRGASAGAILSYGFNSKLTVIDSDIRANSGNNGGGIQVHYGSLEIANSTIAGNSAIRGGGIAVQSAIFNLSNSTISDNTATSAGGGVYLRLNSTTVATISNSNIAGNSASATSASGAGGGLFIRATSGGGTVTIESTALTDNRASEGGAIWIDTPTGTRVDIVDCTVSENTASTSGGGVYIQAFYTSEIVVRATTIDHNSAAVGGGAFVTLGGGSSATFEQSTISGNSAAQAAGGIQFVDVALGGLAVVRHSTVTDNSSLGDVPGTAGGIQATGSELQFLLDHALVAGNHAAAQSTPDISVTGVPAFTTRSSLIGVGSGSGLGETLPNLPDPDGNLVGGPVHGAIDPLLGPLADNGGATLTHALLPGSPAINAGDLNAQPGVGDVPLYDQRGEPFGRVFGGRIDIGAFEYQQSSDLNLLVDTLVDESDGNYSRGDLSLREAIVLANLWPSTDTIRFDPALTAAGPATILLTQGELKITDDVTITGPGANLLTIDASGNDPTPDANDGRGSRILNIDDGTASTMIVSLTGLTVTGGDTNSSGGGIFSKEALTITDCTITGNASRLGNGGGVYLYVGNGSTAAIARSQVFENDAPNAVAEGGGITIVNRGSATISDTLVLNNHSGDEGGGIAFGGNLTIERCIITGNTAGSRGGGIMNGVAGGTAQGALLLVDSEVSNNTSRSGGGIMLFEGPGFVHTIQHSTISKNSATGSGGGVFWQASSFSIVDSTVEGNTAAVNGGGIYAARLGRYVLAIDRVTISNNSAQNGGGIWMRAGTISESTITGNAATTGGGVFTNGDTTITDTTIHRNNASGVGDGVLITQGTLFLNQSIVALNSVALIGEDVTGLLPTTISARFSLIGTNNGTLLVAAPVGSPDANGNLIGGSTSATRINPLLGPLANNGGSTMTYALLPNSPAINAGDPTAVAGVGDVPFYDQRGEPFGRVFGGRIDIGAFESQPNPLPGDYNFNGIVDLADSVIWRDTLGSTTDLRADGNEDGVVNDADRAIWMANFGKKRSGELVLATSINAPALTVRQPRALPEAVASRIVTGRRDASARNSFAAAPTTAVKQDAALVAWLTSRTEHDHTRNRATRPRPPMDSTAEEATTASAGALDHVFDEVGKL